MDTYTLTRVFCHNHLFFNNFTYTVLVKLSIKKNCMRQDTWFKVPYTIFDFKEHLFSFKIITFYYHSLCASKDFSQNRRNFHLSTSIGEF